jgi:hypothetical protein
MRRIRTICGLFATSAALFLASSAGLTSVIVQAQPKTATVQTQDKTKPSHTDAPGGTVEVYQAKDGWRFRIKDAQGKSLAIGVVAYSTQEEAVQTLQQIQRILNQQQTTLVPPKKK